MPILSFESTKTCIFQNFIIVLYELNIDISTNILKEIDHLKSITIEENTKFDTSESTADYFGT